MKHEIGRLLRRLDHGCGTDFYYSQTVARRLSRVIAPARARWRVILAGLLFGTRRWNRPVTLRVDAPGGVRPFIVPDYAGLKVLDEVFYRGEYDLDLVMSPTTIVDLGSHVGASALFFRRKWPDARITAVEASPHLVEILRRNVDGLGIEVRHAALTATTGTASFIEGTASWNGKTREATGENEVPALALDDLLADPVDLMKLDIEGGEFVAIPASARLRNAAVIVGEIHAEPETQEARRLLDSFEGFAVSAEGDGSGHTLFRATRE